MNAYDFFDDIVCVTLASRPDRRAHAQATLDALGIPARFATFDKHPLGGTYGCFESHLQVVRRAYAAGAHSLLVLEDDIYPTASYSPAKLQQAVDFMRANEGAWDVFYLGYFVFDLEPAWRPFLLAPTTGTATPHVIKYRPLATHALVLSRSGMRKVLEAYPRFHSADEQGTKALINTHYDAFLSSSALSLDSFCITPMLLDQKLCLASDIAANNVLESAARSMQCAAERTRIMYRASYVKDWLGSQQSTWVVAVLLVALLTTAVIARKSGR